MFAGDYALLDVVYHGQSIVLRRVSVGLWTFDRMGRSIVQKCWGAHLDIYVRQIYDLSCWRFGHGWWYLLLAASVQFSDRQSNSNKMSPSYRSTAAICTIWQTTAAQLCARNL